MVSFPNAKINLGLFVTGKRNDGYHNMASIIYPIPLHDALELCDSQDGKFHFSSSGLAIPGNHHDNLIVKTWNILKQDFKLPQVQIHLHKAIPMGAGLGGGSADAAFAIKLINEYFELGLSTEIMKNYASRLGMDCPFFICNKPAYAFERGDQLEEVNLNLSGKFLVLIKPDFHVSTKDAYAGIDPSIPNNSICDLIKQPIKDWKMTLENDFEKTLFRKFPRIGEVKNQLYNLGALYASMSGSGSSVFGIFETEIDLKKHFPNYFYWHGCLK